MIGMASAEITCF